MRRHRVLIVDDSALTRRVIAEALAGEAEIEVVGTAASGRQALERIPQVHPDLLTLDVEMPELDGIATLDAVRKTHPGLQVIMFSTLTQRGAEVTLDALLLGANDYATKPTGSVGIAESILRVRSELVPKIKALRARSCALDQERTVRRTLRPAAPRSGPVECVALGVSTGGPQALTEIFSALPEGFPAPVFVVQHMPPMFTRLLAERLNALSRLEVAEAVDGELIGPGQVRVAPGDWHLSVAAEGAQARVRLNQDPPENSCRPAVDVLFRSVAAAYGSRALAVVLTGMGQDGLKGSEALRAAGSQVIVQDEASSVVWGMPGMVASLGLAEQVLPLSEMAGEMVRRVSSARGAAKPSAERPAPKPTDEFPGNR